MLFGWLKTTSFVQGGSYSDKEDPNQHSYVLSIPFQDSR
jgi:hypothetical protein